MKLIDITPTINPNIQVWPGDVPYSRQVNLDYKTGDNLVLSAITTTLHVGAHADAPNHYHPEGRGIETRDLARYIGPCQVIRVTLPRGERIYPHHLEGRAVEQPRVLLATGSYPDHNHWNSDFNALSPELISYLAERKVILVGIDTPSVDPQESKVLESHGELYRRDMAVLEGIVLTDVEEGNYFLMAQPLKIADADAGPVRAVLAKGLNVSP